jgi:hypothetical protein
MASPSQHIAGIKAGDQRYEEGSSDRQYGNVYHGNVPNGSARKLGGFIVTNKRLRTASAFDAGQKGSECRAFIARIAVTPGKGIREGTGAKRIGILALRELARA